MSKPFIMNKKEQKYKINEKPLQEEEDGILFNPENVVTEKTELDPILSKLLQLSNEEAEKKKGKPHSDVMKQMNEKYLK